MKIKTKIDNSNLKKDLSNAKKELEKLKKEENTLNDKKIKLELDKTQYEKELEEIKAETNKMLESAQTPEQVDATLGIETSEIDNLNKKYTDTFNNLNEINNKIKENKLTQDQLNNSIDQMNSNLNKVNDFENIKGSIKDVNKSITNSIKKVGKWALAIFGVRSAYMLVRNVASTLSQYNEQIGFDLEYIRYALASSMQPLIEKLINLAYTLLGYINMIAKAWFNVDLFANASAKNMKKASKNAKDTANSLFGFDEINKTEDNTSSDSNGISTPSMDLSSMNMEVPGWMQWIIDNKDLILSILGGITAGLISIKLLGLDPILGLGIGLIVAGIIETIQGIINFIKDPSWENFAQILTGLTLILAGVAVAMLSVNAANPVAWIVLAIAAITALVALIIKYWDQIYAWLQKIASWIYDNIIKPVFDFFSDLFNGIASGISSGWNFAIGILSKIGNWIYRNIIQPIANFFSNLWSDIISGVTLAIEKVKRVFNTLKTFIANIISTIVNLFKNIGTKVGNAISGAFKTVINGILSAIENILNFPIKSVNKLLDVINAVPGISIKKLSTFELPRLASGGILDVPRTGVNIGGAIAGEAGAEGVLPLTNPETMARLGKEIGQWITLYLNITNEMDGRILNKNLEIIKARDKFARNGG